MAERKKIEKNWMQKKEEENPSEATQKQFNMFLGE